jgi:hypothetical protein
MKNAILLSICALAAGPAVFAAATHVWEKQEITLTAQQKVENPYRDVDVWVDLKGPGFAKRVYGFWDGGNTFRVRVLATTPGEWSWVSGSNTSDAGLNGKTGSFSAQPWTEAEKAENLCRRGFLRATANQHALEHADGTPFFLLGDTWWSVPTLHFPWAADDTPRPIGPKAMFQDYVRLRKSQGYNSVAILAAFPHWANDGKPARIVMDDADKTPLRSAWPHPGTKSSKDMHNEGGRPFLFPGKVPGYEQIVPDMDRINPEYFRYLDRKLDHLNAQGFIPFMEVARRDISLVWKKYYKWPATYARYIQYVFARYQANNMILSPIHVDSQSDSIPGTAYNPAIQMMLGRIGPPPFGTLLSANCAVSTLITFGNEPDGHWVTLHQTGNAREHEYYWNHTEIFYSKPTRPSISGEPYYAAWRYRDGVELPNTAKGGSERDNRFCRSAMYGNFLSGGLGGHIYGAEGIWQSATEEAAPVKMWEAFQWESGAQMKHFRAFVWSFGRRFQDLIPATEHILPNSNHVTQGFDGWAYCARSESKDLFIAYLEKGVAKAYIRSAPPQRTYAAKWFNPRTGEWSGAGTVRVTLAGRIELPAPPTDDDWALTLTATN